MKITEITGIELDAYRRGLAEGRDEAIREILNASKLRARAAEVVAAWTREDDTIADAIEMLGRALEATPR